MCSSSFRDSVHDVLVTCAAPCVSKHVQRPSAGVTMQVAQTVTGASARVGVLSVTVGPVCVVTCVSSTSPGSAEHGGQPVRQQRLPLAPAAAPSVREHPAALGPRLANLRRRSLLFRDTSRRDRDTQREVRATLSNLHASIARSSTKGELRERPHLCFRLHAKG